MSSSAKRYASAAIVLMLALAMGKAALPGFRAKQEAIYAGCRADRQRLGAAATKDRYPTPEIHMVSGGCMLPGATAQVVVKGKFAPGTKFVFESDALQVLNETLSGNEYRATIQAPAGIGPQAATLVAISPVTCITARQDAAVRIAGSYEWTMNAANGWKVVARSAASDGCTGSGRDSDRYDVLFYRNGQTQPFEKRSARLSHSAYEQTNYRFTIDEPQVGAPAGMEDMQKLMMKMSDPKLTDAQREQVMAQLQKIQTQMQASLERMADPANAQKIAKQQEEARLQFGCRDIALTEKAGALTGELRCSERVGREIALTGAMKFTGK